MRTLLRRVLRDCAPHGLIESRRRSAVAGSVWQAPVPMILETKKLVELLPRGLPDRVHLPGIELVRDDFMVSPLRELSVIGAICGALEPGRIFEFGTYIGSATRVMAMNCAARIVTLDLDAGTRTRLLGPKAMAGTDGGCGSAFRGTAEASRIEQVLGDSRAFDFTPYEGTMDLVFVDANHTYPFVKNDSEWAWRLVRSGGVVLWDDYVYGPDHPECCGVAQYLGELKPRLPCYHIAGTRLAIGFAPLYRHD